MNAHPGTRAHVSAILADYFKLPEPVTWADVQAFLEAEISDREGLQSIYTESAPSYVNAPPEVLRAIGHARLFADSDAHARADHSVRSTSTGGKNSGTSRAIPPKDELLAKIAECPPNKKRVAYLAEQYRKKPKTIYAWLSKYEIPRA